LNSISLTQQISISQKKQRTKYPNKALRNPGTKKKTENKYTAVLEAGQLQEKNNYQQETS